MKIFENLRNSISNSLLDVEKGPSYKTLVKDQKFQIRNYNKAIVAETIVESSHEEAGSKAFGILAGYIFGKNEKNQKIEMTAPVSQFQIAPGKYAVQFYMPHEWTLQTLPKPLDSRINLK